MVGIGTRETDPRLQALFDAGKKVYSISKCNTIEECLFEAYNSYILHNRGMNGIYGILGTKIHDKLEDVICDRATADELPAVLNEELLDLDMLGIEFPKDFKGNDTIRQNWVADMKHFCNTFVPPKGSFTTEELIIYRLSENRYLQGYVDLVKHNADGTISIYDWKTSTNFKADDLIHHGRQLAIYAVAKEAEGFTVKEVAWIMLKYCEVSFLGKARVNSKEKTSTTKVINRGKIVKELRPQIEQALAEFGHDEIEIEFLMKVAMENNEIPADVSSLYTIKPYVRKYDVTEEAKQEAINYINEQADLFEQLELDKNALWPPRKFTKTNKLGKESEDTFFCNMLCNFRKTCEFIKQYNDTKTFSKSEDEDLF